jgi:hypothetical protein
LRASAYYQCANVVWLDLGGMSEHITTVMCSTSRSTTGQVTPVGSHCGQ